MEFDADIQNAQNSMAGFGALGSVFGSLFALSDARLKTDLERIDEWNGIPIYAYNLLGVRKIGVLAQDVMKIMPEAVREFEGWYIVAYGEL